MTSRRANARSGGWALRAVLLLATCAVCAARVGAAAAPSPRARDADPLLAPRIVNGTYTQALPAVGALLTPADPHSGFTWCSGTLIGCETFLTAAHCVCNDIGATCQTGGAAQPNPADFAVFLQHAGIFAVQSIHVEPSFDFPVGDVAVLKLATPVTAIRPSQILTSGAPPDGTIGTIAGFGISSGTASDYALKRLGEVMLAACPLGISGTTSVCWDFLAPLGPAGTDSNTCSADSGGPLFVDLGAGPRIAGTTSGGTNNACAVPDHGFDANVVAYASYIQAQAGADLANTTCGKHPQVGDPAAVVDAVQGTVAPNVGAVTHAIQVPVGTTSLRVALNADETLGNDFDLWLRAGAKPTQNVFDCRATGTSQYGYCEIASPTPGTWWARVKRKSGSGPFQLTATTLHRLTPPVSDFDGDGLADLAVVDRSTGAWSAIGSTSGPGIAYSLGGPGQMPVPGDYDGDGKTDVAVYERSSGTWSIRSSSSGATGTVVLGGPGWRAAPGDFDGDGKTDVAVHRKSTGAWMAIGSTAGAIAFSGPAGATLVPAPGDYDGDGITDFAVYDPSLARFTYVGSASGPGQIDGLGGSGYQPVGGDFDGDGLRDFAVYANGAFDVRRSSTGQISRVAVGVAGDLPAAADYDGDGITDFAVFTPLGGTWTIVLSGSGSTIQPTFGSGAKPAARWFAGW